ncbi:heterokaryon incompatibility protein-domain-containing protein [Lasiosphaeria hispida]|uniref:Heterokaryon incompatibility protein-domain-containing protein n=1 Tax=Lasiosphaeria hispida TaxID=260671 RepID=A0AAJ0HUG6_9PEZI|nr:heterokaryon incompatibility protein-domain-containing protein [Lasiosphaeria hispida]
MAKQPSQLASENVDPVVPDQGNVFEPGASKKEFLPLGASQPLYLPLVQGQVIRLIELQPGTWNDAVSIRLFITELGYAPEYDAISYVWGDGSNTVPILCNGRRFDVTVNLCAAFKRIRLEHQTRIVWADAVCINQQSMPERSHHVAFMGDVYRHAKKVLVCLGKDVDGGAEHVASLVHDVSSMVRQHPAIGEMPRLTPRNPLADDARWKAVVTMHNLPWFTRAWVIQEVGLARDPHVLYGGVSFSYRDLMKLAEWCMECAPILEVTFGLSFFSIHASWGDWSDSWRETSLYPDSTLLELLNQSRGLSCRDDRDHIYSLLGHPLARLEGGGLLVTPDYSKDPMHVWFELAVQLLQQHGLRVLSAVEHNSENLASPYPSWVPWCWPEEYTSCSLGVFPSFYYGADGGMALPPSGAKPWVDGHRQLHVEGALVDVLRDVYVFTPLDLSASPAKLHDMISGLEPEEPQSGLRSAWTRIRGLAAESSTAYGPDWLTPFSLTLLAGLSAYKSAELDMVNHRHNCAAYLSLWLKAVFGPDGPEIQDVLPRIKRWATAGSMDDVPISIDELQSLEGDADRYFVDMKLMCDGRSFFVTEKGYFGIGSWIAKKGDLVCVVPGAKCPFVLRRVADEESRPRKCRFVQDAYVHGLMRGEAVSSVGDGQLDVEPFAIC